MDFSIILKSPIFFLPVAQQKEFPPVKYHPCRIDTLKGLKFIKFRFSAILADFYEFCSKNLSYFEGVSMESPKQFFL